MIRTLSTRARRLSVYRHQQHYIYSSAECQRLIAENINARYYIGFSLKLSGVHVGSALISWPYRDDGTIQIDNFFIDRHYQGKGIGSAAFSAMIGNLLAFRPSCKKLVLYVHEENEAAKGMFVKCGFTRATLKTDCASVENLMTLSRKKSVRMERLNETNGAFKSTTINLQLEIDLATKVLGDASSELRTDTPQLDNLCFFSGAASPLLVASSTI